MTRANNSDRIDSLQTKVESLSQLIGLLGEKDSKAEEKEILLFEKVKKLLGENKKIRAALTKAEGRIFNLEKSRPRQGQAQLMPERIPDITMYLGFPRGKEIGHHDSAGNRVDLSEEVFNHDIWLHICEEWDGCYQGIYKLMGPVKIGDIFQCGQKHFDTVQERAKNGLGRPFETAVYAQGLKHLARDHWGLKLDESDNQFSGFLEDQD
jgi:hypothetical protein